MTSQVMTFLVEIKLWFINY